jgi:two-component system sensor histidine kinase PilS (NtrC family)
VTELAPERPESLTNIPAPTAQSEIRRRVTYLMLFRLVLISLVLGLTLTVWWFTDADQTGASSLWVFAIIGATYLLTLIYALALRSGFDATRLGELQLAVDLVITTMLVHVTGGPQSAYTFFFPLSIIGAASVRFRAGALAATVASVVLFTSVSLLAWSGLLPTPAMHGVAPAELSGVDLARSLGLNLAAFAGVGLLAVNLGQQIQQTVASLVSEREAAADLYTLHEDTVRCLSSGLITVDNRERILTINHAACELLATEPTSAIGRPIEKLLPGIDSKLAKLPGRAALRRGDLVTRAAGDKLVLGLSVSPLRDNQDQVIGRVINFSDLTELRKMEKQVKHAERLAAIGTLAAGIAHEIRNPLASISGSVELLASSPPDADNRPLMEIITREIDRLNAMIKDLLDYASPGPREVVEFDFAAMVVETVQVFEQDPGIAGVTIEVTDGAIREQLYLVGDPAKLKQVIWNLLRNAAEAAATGGAHVSIDIRESAGYAEVEVCDDGPGMDPDEISQVFDPFFTTKEGGSGLGLATSHNIVTEHGGQIQAGSSDQGGARFTVRLPMGTTGSFAEWRRDAPVQAYNRGRDE